MAAQLRQRFGPRVEVELVDGGRGIFDVKLDDTLVFSKHAQGRFPEDGEVERLLQPKIDVV